MAGLSANRHLRSADWHFMVPIGIPNFAPTPCTFLTHFLYFCVF